MASVSGKENHDAATHKTGPDQALRVLRETVGKEAIQRNIGKHEHILAEKILRFGLLRHGGKERASYPGGVEEEGGKVSGEGVPGVPIREECWDSSHKRKPSGQHSNELDDSLWSLPYEVALEAWQDEEDKSSLQSMWDACSKERILRKALAEVQEIWRSLDDKEKAWIAVCAGESISKSIAKNRVQRLKALGNGIVPQCAEVFARAILGHLTQGKE